MNEVQSEPTEVQPGSFTADALAASVEEKFAALFRQVHPPVLTVKPNAVGARKETSAEELN